MCCVRLSQKPPLYGRIMKPEKCIRNYVLLRAFTGFRPGASQNRALSFIIIAALSWEGYIYIYIKREKSISPFSRGIVVQSCNVVVTFGPEKQRDDSRKVSTFHPKKYAHFWENSRPKLIYGAICIDNYFKRLSWKQTAS